MNISSLPLNSLLTTSALLLLLLASPAAPASAFCPVEGSDYLDKPDGNIIKEYFECPGPDDPPDHSVCCDQACCPVRHIDSVLGVDIKVAMAISIPIMFVSLATAITLIICCFKADCPLYDTCSGSYKSRDILPYGEYNEGSDTNLISNGHCEPQSKQDKKFYATSNDNSIKADQAEHV